MKQNLFKSTFAFILLTSLVSFSAQASDENRFRIKVGGSNVHGIGYEYDHSTVAGFEYAHTFGDFFDLGISGQGVFFAAGTSVYTVSLNPAFSITVDQVHFYAGPLAGGLFRKERGYDWQTSVQTQSFGLGAFAGVDFNIVAGLLLNASVQYIGSVDQTPFLSVLSYGGGLGYQF